MQLYLASTSPRRRELLTAAGIGFALAVPGPEPTGHGAPRALSLQRARAKALQARIPAAAGLVLGVDTVVECGGIELGKPEDAAAARAMLCALAAREHTVHTAHVVQVRPAGQVFELCASARVRCAALTPMAIEQYLASGEWSDKAGGYGIQGAAGAFMRLVSGEFDTVVGLSVAAVRTLLARAGAVGGP